MALDPLHPDERQRIYDEEHDKIREEAYRSQVRREIRNDMMKPTPVAKRPILAAVGGFVLFCGVLGMLGYMQVNGAIAFFVALAAGVIGARKLL